MEQEMQAIPSTRGRRSRRWAWAAGAVVALLGTPIAFGQAAVSLPQIAATLNQLLTKLTALDTYIHEMHMAMQATQNPTALVTAPVQMTGAPETAWCNVTNAGAAAANVTIQLVNFDGAVSQSMQVLVQPGAAQGLSVTPPPPFGYCRFTADVPTSTLRASLAVLNVTTHEVLAITQAK